MQPAGGMSTRSHLLSIPCSGIELAGELVVPDTARGIVLFAHGSGSSRASPRNRFVAEVLQRRGFATLLVDLATPEEDQFDTHDTTLRSDLDLLSERLLGVTDWAARDWAALGYFGASTGAAAALVAAARRPGPVRAIVARGGRLDLATAVLAQVHAPTLLVVGGRDRAVLELNRLAIPRLAAPASLVVVPEASYRFDEPGALDQVGAHTAAWFERYLYARPLEEIEQLRL